MTSETGIPAIDRLVASERRNRWRTVSLLCLFAALAVFTSTVIADLSASLNRRSVVVEYQANVAQQTSCRNDIINDYRLFAIQLFDAVIETDMPRRERIRAELKAKRPALEDRIAHIDVLCPPVTPPADDE